MSSSVRVVAGISAVSFSALTIGTAIASIQATNVVALAALTTVATLFLALAVSSVTAFFAMRRTEGLEQYFERFKDHAVIGTIGLIEIIANAFWNAMITRAVDRISGRDRVNVRVTHEHVSTGSTYGASPQASSSNRGSKHPGFWTSLAL